MGYEEVKVPAVRPAAPPPGEERVTVSSSLEAFGSGHQAGPACVAHNPGTAAPTTCSV